MDLSALLAGRRKRRFSARGHSVRVNLEGTSVGVRMHRSHRESKGIDIWLEPRSQDSTQQKEWDRCIFHVYKTDASLMHSCLHTRDRIQ